MTVFAATGLYLCQDKGQSMCFYRHGLFFLSISSFLLIMSFPFDFKNGLLGEK